MKTILIPTNEHLAAYDACISNMSPGLKRSRLVNAKSFVMHAGEIYKRRIGRHRLYTIQETSLINGVEMKKDMISLYDEKLARKGQPGRIYYDKWRSSAPNGRCPLCGIKPVSTLDHYLSKSRFPIYAVFPYNLIPACRDCNTEKLNHVAKSYAEETLHPYFDNVDDEQWLFAEIIKTKPASFRFYVVGHKSWHIDMKSRIEKHIAVYKIDDLYASHGAEELSNIRLQLKMLYKIGGEKAVKAHLQDGYKSRLNVNHNSWQTAVYRAMYKSKWFCENGFKP